MSVPTGTIDIDAVYFAAPVFADVRSRDHLATR